MVTVAVVPGDEAGDFFFQCIRLFPDLLLGRTVIAFDLAVGLRVIRSGEDMADAPGLQVIAKLPTDQG